MAHARNGCRRRSAGVRRRRGTRRYKVLCFAGGCRSARCKGSYRGRNGRSNCPQYLVRHCTSKRLACAIHRRVLQNNFSEKWSGRETELLQRQEEEATSYAAARAGADFDTAAVVASEVVDLIADVPPAAEVVERMMTGATQLLAGASNKYRITTG